MALFYSIFPRLANLFSGFRPGFPCLEALSRYRRKRRLQNDPNKNPTERFELEKCSRPQSKPLHPSESKRSVKPRAGANMPGSIPQ